MFIISNCSNISQSHKVADLLGGPVSCLLPGEQYCCYPVPGTRKQCYLLITACHPKPVPGIITRNRHLEFLSGTGSWNRYPETDSEILTQNQLLELLLGTGSCNYYPKPVYKVVTHNQYHKSLPGIGFWNCYS